MISQKKKTNKAMMTKKSHRKTRSEKNNVKLLLGSQRKCKARCANLQQMT
jgi:hypothetical protein